MTRHSAFNYIFNKHPRFTIVVLILLFLYPVCESVSKWNEHPKTVTCGKETDVCKVLTYSYDHKICWNTIISSRHSHRACNLPKRMTSEQQLLNLSKIADVRVKGEKGIYRVIVADKDNNEALVAQYKSYDRAKGVAGQINAHIKNWQIPESQRDYLYSESPEHNYEYSFTD